MSTTKYTKYVFASTLAALLALMPSALRGQTESDSQLRSKIERLEETQQAGETFEAATGQERGEEALQEYLAAKLVLDNHSKIQLAELAEQRANFDAVKQLAETIADDHRQLNSQLQQIAPISDLFSIGPAEIVPQPAALEAGRQDQTSQAPTRDEPADAQRPRAESKEAAPLLQAGVTHRLLRIKQQAVTNQLRMINEMLRQYEGQDFDMGFLSQQTIDHTRTLGELQAIEGIGSQAFQKIVQQANSISRRHLERTRQLAEKFESDRLQSAQNGRSAGSNRE